MNAFVLRTIVTKNAEVDIACCTRSRTRRNATNQIGNVMNKPGQGSSELQFQDKSAHRIPNSEVLPIIAGKTSVSKVCRLSRRIQML